MKTGLVAMILLAASVSAGAQIVRPRFQLSQPQWFVSLGVGYQQGWSVDDASGTWQFSDGPQYVASLEKALSSGASVGIAATTALLPARIGSLSYDVNVSQAFATLHLSGGGAIHSSFDFRAGATYYAPFQLKDCPTCTGLAPQPKGDTDFSFGLGYGLGYSFSPRFSLDIVQDWTTSIHQRDATNPSGNASSRNYSTRLIGRLGLGG